MNSKSNDDGLLCRHCGAALNFSEGKAKCVFCGQPYALSNKEVKEKGKAEIKITIPLPILVAKFLKGKGYLVVPSRADGRFYEYTIVQEDDWRLGVFNKKDKELTHICNLEFNDDFCVVALSSSEDDIQTSVRIANLIKDGLSLDIKVTTNNE
jgi:hypothetical protein